MASANHLTLEDDKRLSRVIRAFADGRGDFADYLTGSARSQPAVRRCRPLNSILQTEKNFSAPR